MGRPEHIRAVLFDMDGTTIDSEDIKNDQLAELLRSHGAQVEASELAYVSGMDLQGLLDAIRRFLVRSGVNEDSMDVLLSMPYGREVAYLHPGCLPIEGVIAFLAALREHGIKCALVSNTPAYAVLTALDRFHMVGAFDAIVCGDMIRAHKPDPEGFLLAMSLLGVEPKESVVIEDSTSGIVSGKAAGAYVCALEGSGVHDLSAADEMFRSYSELTLW